MSLRNRLEKLEGHGAAREAPGGGMSRCMERYVHAHENARREIEGREPLPDLPYTEEDREDDRACLLEVIPAYRAATGWQTEKARNFLDAWEQRIREKLAKLEGD
jgi:hypothetical protein